jgi:1,4-dihydroxy-2-naphthoate octaprenyltransferase
VYGIRHALDARGLKRQSDLERIEIGAKRRWGGILSYAIAVLTVASILTWLLGQFTNSWWLALGLVGFMLGYMLLMGYLASRDRR